MIRKTAFSLLFLLFSLLGGWALSFFPEGIEKCYIPFRLYLDSGISRVFGIWAYSFFEAGILLFSVWLLFFLGSIVFRVIRRWVWIRRGKDSLFLRGQKISFRMWLRRKSVFLIHLLCWVAILFIWGMGIDYYRTPLSRSLGAEGGRIGKEQLVVLCEKLLDGASSVRDRVAEDERGRMILSRGLDSTLLRAGLGYRQAAEKYPFIPRGDYGRPKKIALSRWMCYTMIVGIYSPFTKEANVNVYVPESSIPFTALHEMAHQRGFAREEEANFVGFLAGISHPDDEFVYSSYSAMLSYVLNRLYREDPARAGEIISGFSPGMKRDREQRREFWEKYRTRIADVSDRVNDAYLKANGQREGVASYGEVIGLLCDYYGI